MTRSALEPRENEAQLCDTGLLWSTVDTPLIGLPTEGRKSKLFPPSHQEGKCALYVWDQGERILEIHKGPGNMLPSYDFANTLCRADVTTGMAFISLPSVSSSNQRTLWSLETVTSWDETILLVKIWETSKESWTAITHLELLPSQNEWEASFGFDRVHPNSVML